MTPGPAEDADDFAAGMRAAIAASGLSLDRLQHRLGLRGASVSVATLSYWQSGRSRPGRRKSLAVLEQLEAILGVEDGSLVALLGPPRPRGRASQRDVLSLEALWVDREPVPAAFAHIDTQWDEQLSRISVHDRLEVGPDRRERSLWVRQVLRAQRPGADRLVLMHALDDPTATPPMIRPLLHCRQGRSFADFREGVLVAELLFDRTLARGETIITEHRLQHHVPGPLATWVERRHRFPVREYVVEVSFAPATLPVRCEQYDVLAGAADPERTRPLTLDSSNCAHAVALDFGPGIYGLRWHWQ